MKTNENIQRRAEQRPQERAQERHESVNQRPIEAPAVDIFESKDELLVVADLPGVTSDAVSIHFEKNKLTLEGRPTEAASAQGPQAQRGFDYRRTFLVPQGIDAEAVHAEMKHGVLRVHLPKAAPFKPRQIPVKAG